MATIENGGVNSAAQAENTPLHLENLRRDLALMRQVVVSAIVGRLDHDALRGVEYGLVIWEAIATRQLAALKSAEV